MLSFILFVSLCFLGCSLRPTQAVSTGASACLQPSIWDNETSTCVPNSLVGTGDRDLVPHIATHGNILSFAAENLLFFPKNESVQTVNLLEFFNMFEELERDTAQLATEMLSAQHYFETDMLKAQARMSNSISALQDRLETGLNERQKLMTGTLPPNSFMSKINPDGTFVSFPNTMYTPDFDEIQQRVLGGCDTGTYVRVVNEDGTVTCGTDADTIFVPDYSQIQKRAETPCSGQNKFLVGLEENGNPICGDFVPDFSVVQKRPTLNCTAGSNSFATGFKDTGLPLCAPMTIIFSTIQRAINTSCSVSNYARALTFAGPLTCQADTTYSPDFVTTTQKRVTGTCSDSSYVTGISSNGSVTCSTDPIIPKDADVLRENAVLPEFNDDSSSGAHWSGNVSNAALVTNESGPGWIHGPFPGGEVFCIFPVDVPHTHVKVELTYYSIDNWDNEYGYVKIDNVMYWQLSRTDNSATGICGEGWSTLFGGLTNPNNGDRPEDKCFFKVSVLVPHSGTSIKVAVGSNLNESPANEAWAFNSLRVFVLSSDSAEVSLELGSAPYVVDDESDATGWYGRSDALNVTYVPYPISWIHGPYDGSSSPVPVERKFYLSPIHTHIRVKARFWAIDTWDSEYGTMMVDGVEVWRFLKKDPNRCTEGWTSYTGTFPNPASGAQTGQVCYMDVDVIVPHTSTFVTISMFSNINGPQLTDESWAFQSLSLYLNPLTNRYNVFPFYSEKVNLAGWSSFTTSDSGVGSIHGIFDFRNALVQKTFNLGTLPHNAIRLSLRYWAIDTWDTETAYVRVNGDLVWSKTRIYTKTCEADGWITYTGQFVGIAAGTTGSIKCYYLVNVVVPHTSSSLVVGIASNINGPALTDESFAFNDLSITLLL